MRRLKAKLRSRRGASITFALLLFLVCAIISGVVIVAASTAGGRLSSIKDMEQRYYAVTAAADVLREKFDNKTSVLTYTVDDAGAPDTSTIVSTGTTYADKAAKWMLGGTPLSEKEVTYKPDGDTGASYTCTITPQINSGVLDFVVACSGGKSNSTGTYRLQVKFASEIMKSVVDPSTKKQNAKVTWKFLGLRKIRQAEGG